MRGERFELNETETALVGLKTGREVRFGDPIAVAVTGVDTDYRAAITRYAHVELPICCVTDIEIEQERARWRRTRVRRFPSS